MPQIEYVTVANHAEAINGLLYLQGAGFTELMHPVSPDGRLGVFHLGIGVSILIEWTETNRKYPLTIALQHEDGARLFNADVTTEAGRSVGAQEGAPIRSIIAMNAEVQFPRPGRYELRAELAGEHVKSSAFRVNYPRQATGLQ